MATRHGIGVRDGKFCAHLLVRRLAGGGDAVRASIGLGTTAEHVTRLTGALHRIAARRGSRTPAPSSGVGVRGVARAAVHRRVAGGVGAGV